jgi:hypothetical protein
MEGMPPPHLRSSHGQASLDYVGLLAVVGVALAGAGAATGIAAEIPRAVVHAARTGICIAGGDVCRASDAAAAGLAPCLTGETAQGRGLAVTVLSLHLGHRGSWTVAQRSDGSVLITQLEDDAIGLAGGIGLALGPVVDVGAAATFDLSLAHGRAWELPSAAAAAALIAAVRRGDDPPVAPTWRFGDAGEEVAGFAGVSIPGATLTALEASGGMSVGLRVGHGQRTTYVRVHAGVSTPLGDLVPDARGSSDGADGGGAPLLLGVTRDVHGLRELSFRRAAPGAAPGEVVETVGRLDLRDPVNRALAEPLLARRMPSPPDLGAALRAVLLRTARAGVIERSVYAVEDRSHEWAGALNLGLAVGVDVSELDVRRRLVDAGAWVSGSPERRRADCLPELA